MPYSNDYPCEVKDCKNLRRSKMYCPNHYKKYKKYGDPLGGPGSGRSTIHETCTVDNCNKKHAAQGLCQMHYRRFTLYKDVNARPGQIRKGSRLELSPGGYIKVYDPEHANSNTDGFVLEHRKVMADQIGRALLRHEQVHHKNGNRQDNRPENLELWSVRQPPGQRVEDKVQYAIEILELYAPERLTQFTMKGQALGSH